jgi:hypothetical protein
MGRLRACCARFSRDVGGQSLIEAGLVIPVVFFIAIGITELGVALRNQVVVSALAREGSNLISRDVSLEQAATVLETMANGPINLDGNTRVIFSVIKRGASEGTTNFDQLVLYQRFEFGDGPGESRLSTRGAGTFGDAPNYEAEDSDNDSDLQVTNAPAGIVTSVGGLVYVTEVITVHTPFTPLTNFGVTGPTELYSIAYF